MLNKSLRMALEGAGLRTRVMCPYCGRHAEKVVGEVIYPERVDLHSQFFWRCAPCDAYVGCHQSNTACGEDGSRPLGRLANAALRAAKSRAHAAFDSLWESGSISRRQAYNWLAAQLKINPGLCHIGEFDVATCDEVVRLCRARLFDEK